MKIDGGAAFPQSRQFDANGNVISYESYGMSLRDYFAAAALQGILASVTRDHTATTPSATNGFPIDRRRYAATAFQYADAMLAERDKP